MARVIHKFEVPNGGEFTDVSMPIGAEILHADVQGEKVFVWALVDPERAPVFRMLGFFSTGHPVPAGAVHVGTGIERNFGLAWHVFEIAGEVVSDPHDVVDERTEVPA